MYPVWLGFQGGKGVATGAGAFLPLAPLATGLSVAVFAATLGLTRYVSVSSIAASSGLALFAFLLGAPRPVCWTAAAIATLIAWKHRGNLERIAKGTESRLGRQRS
jgi:glycerol-3-phosphate acyltransferase PlsY